MIRRSNIKYNVFPHSSITDSNIFSYTCVDKYRKKNAKPNKCARCKD